MKAGSVSADWHAYGTVSEAKLTSAVQSKLNATASVTSVSGKTGTVTLTKSDVGLGNVDNTSDANKPVSTAVQAALNAKADTSALAAVATSGSYSDLTDRPTIPAAQVNADWNASSGLAQILNKPSIPDSPDDVGFPASRTWHIDSNGNTVQNGVTMVNVVVVDNGQSPRTGTPAGTVIWSARDRWLSPDNIIMTGPSARRSTTPALT